ncbi:MAG: phosphoethanolamine--lipid A transferase [Desulfamplus sp.]|nr:phosphoethanolamine--lipid A transferase [Desulfamplus sp.]
MITWVAFFFVLFHNFAFFRNVIRTYPITLDHLLQISSVPVVLFIVVLILLNLVCSEYTVKPVIIVLLLVSSQVAYYMDTYNVFVSTHMVQNVLETNADESLELLSPKLLCYFIFLGALPSYVISKIEIIRTSVKRKIWSKIKIISISLICLALLIVTFSRFYTSFFREHKPLRYYTNPTYYVYSAVKYIHDSFKDEITAVVPIGRDAIACPSDTKQKLVILVVGEAVRSDHFSLNGYERETNPLLQQEDVISFLNVSSCATTTAISLPCMFSNLGRAGYSDKKAKSSENLLDILSYAGVHVLWRDNNSDSKDVALRVEYQEFKEPEINPECDEVECRDIGMLHGLQEYINAKKDKDILIVLHQMGNHGPAYYKRYPKSFAKFNPVCETNELSDCTREEIINAYDNALLYTDYFLSQVINILKQNSKDFETAMIYFGDHGESLGENGIYLHGVPYSIAPESQTWIPAILWFGDNFNVNKERLKQKIAHNYSHDNFFHTVLGAMEIQTDIYDPELDIINREPDIVKNEN